MSQRYLLKVAFNYYTYQSSGCSEINLHQLPSDGKLIVLKLRVNFAFNVGKYGIDSFLNRFKDCQLIMKPPKDLIARIKTRVTN